MTRSGLLMLTVLAGTAVAQPVVPDGFSVRRIAPLLDGQIAELEAVDGGLFGSGVITTTLDSGVLTVRLVQPGVILTVGTARGIPSGSAIESVRLVSDAPGFTDALYATTSVGTTQNRTTTLWRFRPRVSAEMLAEYGPGLGIQFVPVSDVSFEAGLYGWDSADGGGEDIVRIGPDFHLEELIDNGRPSFRPDFDVQGLAFDRGGAFGGHIYFADSDFQGSSTSAISGLTPSLEWIPLVDSRPFSLAIYNDLDIASSGPFAGMFAVNTVGDLIERITPDGSTESWANGFTDLRFVAIAPDGRSMYASDRAGIWLIRAEGDNVGPILVALDPAVPRGSTISGDAVASFRVVFNEPVTYTDADITITDRLGQPVPFDASGSNSQFMLIGLGEPLFGDTYTVTIADSVTSVATGEPLDGDKDGFAGGDAVLEFTHRCPGDFNGDETINTLDVLQFLNAWNAGCP